MGNQNELTGNMLVHGRLCKPLRIATVNVIGLWHTKQLLEELHGTQQSVQVASRASAGMEPGCSSGRKTGRGVCGYGLLRGGSPGSVFWSYGCLSATWGTRRVTSHLARQKGPALCTLGKDFLGVERFL